MRYIAASAALLLLIAVAVTYSVLGLDKHFFAQHCPNQGVEEVIFADPDKPIDNGYYYEVTETAGPVCEECCAGLVRSALSGLFIEAEVSTRRPFAIVIGNSGPSLPQSGLSQAEIIYEVIAEGTTTRIIGIFQDFDSSKIGSIRSARDYFIDIALDYDSIFVHFGGSPQAFEAISRINIAAINGLQLDGGVRTANFNQVVFWRDATRWRTPALREHSAYTSAENLLRHATRFRSEINIPNMAPFIFYEEPSNHQDAMPATNISVQFSTASPVVFRYNDETSRYYRFYGANQNMQIDEETGEQLAVENVIVQLTRVAAIPGDTAGRRNVAVIGSGRGYLFTNGTVIPLLWSKADHRAPTVWTFECGEPLALNVGSTWINITDRTPTFE
ncbi:MAG: DUF3048 domain-containing protein [Defluviitaleaceae bacterium]|nr:DUF3048 domain-containing protein [Defluviitaleaceae bacterium]